jgi:hypothetical protein
VVRLEVKRFLAICTVGHSLILLFIGEILESLEKYEELYVGKQEMLCNMCSRTFTDTLLFQAHVKAHQVKQHSN